MPKLKSQKQKRSSPKAKKVVPDITPEQAHQEINGMLHQLKGILDINNEARKEISAFHERVGKMSAANMTSRERAEAKALYSKSMPKFQEGYEHMFELLNKMKRYRENAIETARDKNEVNAIDVMNLRHGCLPVMDLETTNEPYGAGAVQWPDSKRLKKKDEVAAFVDSSKTWILAEVAGAVSNHRYECIDIDDRERKTVTFARKQLIPLPKYTVYYERYPYMAIEPKGIVLAIFPGTTCFYEGIVFSAPIRSSGMYWIRFVDTGKPDNYGDPVEVSERYVVAFRPDPKIYIRPEKREELLALKAGKTIESKKKGRKVKTELAKTDELESSIDQGVVDEKDVPGPAPKPNYYESPDEDYKVSKKGKKVLKKPKKVKIIRAKVPPHKKRLSTRQFGKRRVKRKKPVLSAEGDVVDDRCESKTDANEEEDNEVEMQSESKDDDYQDAKADLSSDIGNDHKKKDDEEEESEETEEQSQKSGEEEEKEDKRTSGRYYDDSDDSDNSDDSDDSDDSDNSAIFDDADVFKRIPQSRSNINESDMSELSRSERSSSESSSDDDAQK